MAGAILLELSLLGWALVAHKGEGSGQARWFRAASERPPWPRRSACSPGRFSSLARSANRRARQTAFWRPLALNLSVVALLVVVGETSLRAITTTPS